MWEKLKVYSQVLWIMEWESRSVVSNSLRPHGLFSPRNSPDQKTGVGSCSLLQGIFPTQGSTPGLLLCRWILYHLSNQGSPSSINFIYHVVYYIPRASLFTAGSSYLLTTFIRFPFHLTPASGNNRSHLLLWVWFLLEKRLHGLHLAHRHILFWTHGLKIYMKVNLSIKIVHCKIMDYLLKSDNLTTLDLQFSCIATISRTQAAPSWRQFFSSLWHSSY